MRNGDITAYHGPCLLKGSVDDHAVLDIGIVTNSDGVHIAPHHRIEPHRTIVAHDNLPDDYSGLRQKTVLPESGRYSAYFPDKCHNKTGFVDPPGENRPAAPNMGFNHNH